MTTIGRTVAAVSQIEALLSELRLPASSAPAIYELSKHEAPEVGVPGRAEAERAMRDLGIADADRVEALDSRPDEDDDALCWLFERCTAAMVSAIGTVGPLAGWPDLPDELGPRGRYLYVWVFLAAMPYAREFHRARGISDEDSLGILSVLSAQMDNRRALYGAGGLHTQNWVTHHFRGAIFAIGRLHFERTFVSFDAGVAEGAPPAGALALSLHIPEGRLTPESVDDALAQGIAFFRTHFPDEHYRVGICTSWVLDPQLAGYLHPDTNLIRFQRRFQLAPDPGAGQNSTVVEFLFKRDIGELASLPRETTLQRGVIRHIEAGRHWYFRTGWIDLPIREIDERKDHQRG